MDANSEGNHTQARAVLRWETSWKILFLGVTNNIRVKHQSKVWESDPHCLVEYGCEHDEGVMS